MIVKVKWFLTGKVTVFDEANDILNKKTTIAEVKGLIQIRFGFNVSEIVLIKDHLVENDISLGSLGIVGSDDDPILTAHVIRESELEPSNTGESSIDEFSHSDFILAMRMIGKPVPISDERLVAMRVNAPRQRPSFLNVSASGRHPDSDRNLLPSSSIDRFHRGSVDSSSPEGPANRSRPSTEKVGHPVAPRHDPSKSTAYHIFDNVLYGLRKEGVDETFQLPYPGIDPLPFWDLRIPDMRYNYESECEVNELCLELFYYGEFKAITNKQKLIALVHQVIDSKAGVRVRTPFPIREAGCMYPLIAIPIVVSEMDAMVLGDRFFEHFGEKQEERVKPKGSRDRSSTGVGSGGCAAQ